MCIAVLGEWNYRSSLCRVEDAEMAGAGMEGLGLEDS